MVFLNCFLQLIVAATFSENLVQKRRRRSVHFQYLTQTKLIQAKI